MYDGALVFGLLSPPDDGDDPRLAAELRDLTLTWSRYGYRGRILEGETVDDLLGDALELDYRWCLVQARGHVILERWDDDEAARRLEDCLGAWLGRDFLALGALLDDGEGGRGLDDACLLVDLRRYAEAGRPAFGAPGGAPVQLVEPDVLEAGPACGCAGVRVRTLAPSGRRRSRVPTLPGWNLVDASLRSGLPVHDLTPVLAGRRVTLGSLRADELSRLAGYLREGIHRQPAAGNGLAPAARELVEGVAGHLAHARRGVFLWNLEPYDDVRTPPGRFTPPVGTLYAVASGFKPNALLQSLGFDERTRVVFFDYSASALQARRLLLEEWDGTAFPTFARSLFRRLPPPETHYHLPSGATPAELAPGVLERAWARELDAWGGAAAFREHWRRYRGLRHELVHCDVLHDPGPLLERIEPGEDAAVIWWSNAFFTVGANWLHPIAERRRLYERWIDALAERNPGLFLFGADFCNGSVNEVQAGEYRNMLRDAAADGLRPVEARALEIRF